MPFLSRPVPRQARIAKENRPKSTPLLTFCHLDPRMAHALAFSVGIFDAAKPFTNRGIIYCKFMMLKSIYRVQTALTVLVFFTPEAIPCEGNNLAPSGISINSRHYSKWHVACSVFDVKQQTIAVEYERES